MAEYLPRGWKGKRVAVLFERDRGDFAGTLSDNNAAGVFVETTEDEATRTFFIPWTAIRYVELLEEADERRPRAQVTRRPRGL